MFFLDIFEYREEHNVIVVDWEIEASFAYAAASGSVQLVANDLTAFLRVLAAIAAGAPGPVLMKDVHLVGFGLGAHVAGIASRQLPSAIGRVARITGKFVYFYYSFLLIVQSLPCIVTLNRYKRGLNVYFFTRKSVFNPHHKIRFDKQIIKATEYLFVKVYTKMFECINNMFPTLFTVTLYFDVPVK